MCTGKCSRFVALALYPLAILSITLNIALFFPSGETKYAKEAFITEEVKYMGGLIGGGIMVLIPALHIHLTGTQNCCANRCGMFLSIGFAAVGVIGGMYNVIVAGLALQNGPLCDVTDPEKWEKPFENGNGNYLGNSSVWQICREPVNIVPYHLGMFATLLALGCLEVILCTIQMVNGLMGCLCGTCNEKGEL